MDEAARKERNRARLQEAHPVVRAQLLQLLLRMETEGWRPRIQQCWRSLKEQQQHAADGTSHVKWSFHNAVSVAGKPEALAADVLDDDRPLSPSREYLFALSKHAWQLGLGTGLTWGLPAEIQRGLAQAVRTGGVWRKPDGQLGPIGWDPTHVETAAVTLAEARNGARPQLTEEDEG